MPNILIDLAAEFTGKKAFDKADSATALLTKSVKKLGGAIGLAFSARAVADYAKASAKAYAADQKATQLLAINLKNVGLAYSSADAEGFIKSMEKQTAILDDELRPAYAQLAKVTGSVIKTQELMKLAFDVAASNGMDYSSVVDILSQAYVGNYKGLKKLNTGLTNAELATKSFAEVQKILIEQTAGAGQKSLDNYAGAMAKLSVATNNAKETIGYGLLTAFANLAGNGDVDNAVSKIDSVSASLSKMIVVASKLKWYDWIIGGITGGTITDVTKFKGMGNVSMTGGSNMDTQKASIAAAKKAEADAAKRAKVLADLQKKSLKAEQDKAKLAKASAVFDLQKISIAAALKGKISEEEKTRLLLMQAIADEDANKAEKLQKKLEEIQAKNEAIAKSLTEISTATNPFQAWADSLTTAAALLGGMPALITATGALTPRGAHNIPQDPNAGDPGTGGGGGGTGGTGGTGSTGSGNTSIFGTGDTPEEIANKTANAAEDAAAAATAAAASVAESQSAVDALAEAATNGAPATGSSSMYSGNPYSAVGGPGYGTPYPPSNIYINIEGSMLSSDEYVKAVTQALVEGTTNGYNTYRPGAVLP
jgi:hypothetical protein